jgi:hypothetical protein
MSITIPQQGKFSQTNESDLFGNLWYTRNMNFDEAGYAKLSSRTISFKSEKDDSDFNLPLSFGRASNEFHIVTADKAFDLNVATSNFSITEDVNSNAPSLSLDSWGRWFQNRWHASTDTKIWYTTGGSWTDTGATLATGKVHAMETFKNKNSLAVTDGNTVQLLSTVYANTVTLTVPADFECVGLSYSSGKMGVITMMSDTAAGQNQEAFFFVWDGGSTSAGQGYPMGSDTILSIVPYKSSWVILTRAGELLYFNGGGFENLTTLPFAFKNTTWGDSQNRITHGDVMITEGDLIYLNIGNEFDPYGKKGESYVQNNPAGIWCYDPKIGLYHRYAPSISPAYQVSVTSVDTATDILTATGTIPATGNPIKCVDSVVAPIGGVSIGKVYFIIRHTATTFSLAETEENANAGIKVNLTSNTTAKFTAINVLDYGNSRSDRVGGIALMDVRKEIADHLLFGAELNDFNSSSQNDTLNITIPRFENRGCLVFSKVLSQNITDNTKKVYIKYKPLDVNDKFVLKYKEMDALGIPTSTPQWTTATTCTWTSNTELTTTADLSEVKSYLDADTTNQCEVEIISGAGAGQMAQISSISTDGTNYAVTLSDTIKGATSGYFCDISIDNWKLLKTDQDESEVTYLDTQGYKEFPLATSSKWILVKVEFRGSETTLEELKIVNDTQLAAI